jgi:uncharacterized protein
VAVRHELSRRDARRLAVRAQWLHRDRPAGLLELVRHVTLLQRDPTAAVAPSADLVVWSRLGSAYDPASLERALATGDLVEFRGTIRPGEDLALYRADMAVWPGAGPLSAWKAAQRDWVEANDACRRDLLHRLELDGPLPIRELPNTCAVPWKSSGWNDDRSVRMLLDLMVQRGEVAVAERRGPDPLWDLAERVYPSGPTLPLAEAAVARDARRLSALGIARAKGPECPVEPLDVGAAGEEAVVDGVRGTWRVDPALLGQPFAGRAALLSPFDRLLHDRKRMTELFEFEYAVEMYKPKAKRKWGYFALPVLYGDRLVGKLDATSDRRAGVFRVDALHWDAPPTKAAATAVEREIADLARWLRLELRDERDR